MLSHKQLAEAEFLRDVRELRSKFLNPHNSDFLLRKDYDKSIPADGFGDYAHNVSFIRL